jgi:hypothetical protein
MSRDQISPRRPAVMTGFHGFTRFLQATAGTLL